MTIASVAVPTTRVDLRRQDVATEIARVESALGVALDRSAAIIKRRSIGLPTSRNTWVRIEARPYARIRAEQQSWNGTEAAALLTGIAKPHWLCSASWDDPGRELMWRADETSRVPDSAVRSSGVLAENPDLDTTWWSTLAESLDALAGQTTGRIATPDTIPITQERITASVETVFPGRVDTQVLTWTTAHADLNWANLTAPTCMILDWEDWGTAPRGLDAATLWFSSLMLPSLADRITTTLRADLESREGMLSALFLCCQLIASDADGTDRIGAAARDAARVLLGALEG
jgi:hypothetical protein